MKIKALVPFSNGTISMEQYEVREVTDSLGNELISAGIAVEIGGSGLPSVTESDNGKVLTVADGVWTEMGELQPANNLPIHAVVEQDGSISTYSTIDFIGAGYLYNRGCLLVEIYRNDAFEQRVKCDFATDIADGLHWIFRGNYYDMLSNEPKTLAVHFNPPHNPDSAPASITIINTEPINKFIVTLTPTAQDYSGTMDKTVAEINAAYEAGQEIVFRVVTGATTYMEVDCTARWNNGDTYPSFNGFIFGGDNDTLIYAYTGARNDGTWQNYSTVLYTLTPAT